MSWTAVYSRKSQVLGQIPRRDLVAQQYEKIDKEIKEQQDNDLLKDFPKNRIEENVWRWLDYHRRDYVTRNEVDILNLLHSGHTLFAAKPRQYVWPISRSHHYS